MPTPVSSRRRRAYLSMLTLLCLLGFGGLPVQAAEKDGTASVLAALQAAQKHPEREGMAAAVEAVPAAHNGTKDAAARKKLQAALGKALKDKQIGAASVEAAKALGQLDDPKGSYKQLSKILPKPKDAEVTPTQLEAVRSIAALAPDAAIAPLLKIVQKGKSMPASNEAILALGAYGTSKKRTKIVLDLLDITTKLWQAAESAAKNPKGGSGGKPWAALGDSLIASLNKLTGQNHGDAPAWIAALKEHKRAPKGLFADGGK